MLAAGFRAMLAPRALPLGIHALAGLLQGASLYCAVVYFYWSPSALLDRQSRAFPVVIAWALLSLVLWPVIAIVWGRRRGARGRLAAIAACGVATIVGVVLCAMGWDIAGRRALAAAEADLDRAGYRFQAPAATAPVPDDDNLAEWFKRANAAFRGGTGSVPSLVTAGDPAHATDAGRAREIVEREGDALDLARRAGRATSVDWKIDWSKPWLTIEGPRDAQGKPMARTVGELARLMGWKALLAARAGQGAEADEWIGGALQISRAFAALPLGVPQLFAMRMADEALEAARLVLSEPGATARGFARALPDGRLLAGYRRSEAQELTYFPRMLSGASIWGFVHGGPESAARPRLAEVFGTLGGFSYYPVHRLDLARHQRIALAYLRALDAPPAELPARIREAGEAFDRRSWILTELAYGTVNLHLATFYRVMDTEAKGRIASAAIHAREQRKSAGQWPERVEDLDPYTGAPLRSRRDADGFAIWSVGRDFRDDGGRRPSDGSTSGDIAWRLRD